jgi:hypothetical protein
MHDEPVSYALCDPCHDKHADAVLREYEEFEREHPVDDVDDTDET